MILFIICATMIVIGLPLAIIAYNVCYYEEDSWQFKLGSVCAGVGALLLVVFGFVCFMNNCELNVKTELIEYDEKVEELNSLRDYILNIADDHTKTIAVSEYNSKVNDFRTDILRNQTFYNNPWFNWLVSRSCESMDANAVDYIRFE